MRWFALCTLGAWLGATLVLAELRWSHRRDLVQRVAPYLPGGRRIDARRPATSSLRAAAALAAGSLGDRVARLLDVHEPLERRLARLHRSDDAGAVRLRQIGLATLGFGAAGVLVLAVEVPGPTALLFLLGSPLLAFLAVEHDLTRRSRAWQARLLVELPVVCEQLGMLVGSGLSLGGALERVGRRGSGACATDLRRVGRRVAQGLDLRDALAEWADLSGLPAVHRLTAVLALDREASDLGPLLAEEARSLRLEARRQTAALIDRRAQQVWIPVTVATLVPGAVFLAVPFTGALHHFAGT